MKSSNSENRKSNTEAGSGFGRSGQHGEVRKGNTMRRVKEKQNKTWWLKLPYVLVGLYIRVQEVYDNIMTHEPGLTVFSFSSENSYAE